MSQVRSPENDFLALSRTQTKESDGFYSPLINIFNISRLSRSLLSNVYFQFFSEQSELPRIHFLSIQSQKKIFIERKIHAKTIHTARKEQKRKKLNFLLAVLEWGNWKAAKNFFISWWAPSFLLNKYSDSRNISTRTDVVRLTLECRTRKIRETIKTVFFRCVVRRTRKIF